MHSEEFGLDFATRDNIEKAKSGREFERRLISGVLEPLKAKGIIDDYTYQPVYEQCFKPDFEVRKKNKIIIVDTSTTARTDRIHGKQWNAYHAKRIIKSKPTFSRKEEKEIMAFVVVRDTKGREKGYFRRAKDYIKRCSHGSLDGILSVEEFAELLTEI